jgi:hypothetical protein
VKGNQSPQKDGYHLNPDRQQEENIRSDIYAMGKDGLAKLDSKQKEALATILQDPRMVETKSSLLNHEKSGNGYYNTRDKEFSVALREIIDKYSLGKPQEAGKKTEADRPQPATSAAEPKGKGPQAVQSAKVDNKGQWFFGRLDDALARATKWVEKLMGESDGGKKEGGPSGRKGETVIHVPAEHHLTEAGEKYYGNNPDKAGKFIKPGDSVFDSKGKQVDFDKILAGQTFTGMGNESTRASNSPTPTPAQQRGPTSHTK